MGGGVTGPATAPSVPPGPAPPSQRAAPTPSTASQTSVERAELSALARSVADLMTRIACLRDEASAAGDIGSSRTLEAVRRELGTLLALVLRQRDRSHAARHPLRLSAAGSAGC